MMLNCLIFANFTCWNSGDLSSLIDEISEVTTNVPVEQNRILMAYNPIQLICLSCQHLASIAKSVSLYSHQCHTLIDELQDLGSKLIDNFENTEVLEFLFMDIDFKDRTVLNLVTYQGYAPLLANERINDLLEKLWVGKATYKCDGKIEDFSKLSFMVRAPIKRLPGQ